MRPPGLLRRRTRRRDERSACSEAAERPAVASPPVPATSRAAARGSPTRARARSTRSRSPRSPGIRASRSKSAEYNPSASAIQSATVTMMWRTRIGRRLGHQPLAQRVLVAARRSRAGAARTRETRRPETASACASARSRGRRRLPQRLADQFLEPLDLLRLPAELIVEAQHLGDQARTKLKRQLAAGRGRRARRRLRDHVALERGQTARRIRQPRVKMVVELVARDERRPHADARQRSLQALRRAACRDDD